MKTKQLSLIMIAAIMTLGTINSYAQEDTLKKDTKVQVTFGYPLASNGINSQNISNAFSLNILWGVNGGLNGFELGGLMNYNTGDVRGLQFAGILNINEKETKGLIISGVANINLGKSSGFQLSTFNISASDFSGFQLGVMNYAKKLNGVQLGVVNISEGGDNIIPIGIFNVVKGGLYEVEVTAGEVLYANINYKMGVEKFYTIFKLGYSSFEGAPVYSYGIGFGTNIAFADKHKLSIDLSTNAIVYDNNWSSPWTKGERNVLYKLDVNYKYSINDRLSLMVGPSFNVYDTQVKVNGEFGTLNTPYTISSTENENRKSSMWIGFNAGLSFKL